LANLARHALAGDARLAKYFPGEDFDLKSTAENTAQVAKIRKETNTKAKADLAALNAKL
jgi:hypothetical protein